MHNKTALKQLNIDEKLRVSLEQILIYTYKFRYVNRQQIQDLQNHKYSSKIITWLNILSDSNYLREYESKVLPRKPTVYSLGTMGRKYLLKHTEIEDINFTLLNRVWKESKYGQAFKNRCMFVCDIFLSLRSLVKGVDQGEGKLHFFTTTDLQGVPHIITPLPDSYFAIEESNGQIKRYYLEIFDKYSTIPQMQQRVFKYISYFKKSYWQDNMKNEFPRIIIILPNYSLREKMQGFIKVMLTKNDVDMQFFLTTKDDIKFKGMVSQVLHKVE